MDNDWSKKEVSLIVEDYFAMLQLELEGRKFNKAKHNRGLLPHLNNRTKGSIEFKHQNISAVLAEIGQPFIKGYKPKSNYQQLLVDQVLIFLQKRELQLEPLFESFADQAISADSFTFDDFESCLDEAPETSESKPKEITFGTTKVNYLEKEQNNSVLGVEGERFVIDYEKWRLTQEGRTDLIKKVEWIAKDKGDGAGYDILSKNIDGSDRYIEVKTTKLTKETPIYLTYKEISFATKHSANFYLYRVFNFNSKKKLFIKQGNYEHYCHLIPTSYKGFF